MARTKPIAHPSHAVPPRVRFAGKGVQLLDGTFVEIDRPMVSQKTPTHKFIHVGSQHGGKTYIPKPPKVRKPKRITYTAPPLKGLKPAKNGAVVLHEIRHFQGSTSPVLPLQPFERLVRQLLEELMKPARITSNAIRALRVASEDYIAHLIAFSYRITLHSKRITLHQRDIQLCKLLMENPWASEQHRFSYTKTAESDEELLDI
ncbi:hypothetical protein NP233_g11730 [Leucocoprinus birnbaumii]|uniref:Core Histone H2A/H2B/H3 domain-containing protein n=1 Tax=Leucocoprinus birnbaumii TaxID=56174 RepID=A0AAD5VLN1_9AGAR|nr:hypothetical protein NP233_g11730 [Leucocoprinus birnbaumii]